MGQIKNVSGLGLTVATGPNTSALVLPGQVVTVSDALATSYAQNSVEWQLVTTPTSYTASPGDLVLADGSSGAFDVYLPPVAYGGTVWVKKTDTSANAITVEPNLADQTLPTPPTIDGASSYVLGVPYQTVFVVSDGTNWFVNSPPDVAVLPLATTGPPTTGTWPAGSAVVDSTGAIYTSPAGGSPGTWDPSGAYLPVFSIARYGGSASNPDNSQALENALADVFNAGGGAIYYPAASTPYKHLAQIRIPTNGATNPPLTVPIRICGDGATWNDASGALDSGTQLDFRYAGRTITDMVTDSTTTITSATANFTSDDIGAFVVAAGITADRTVISSVTNSTTAVLSVAALTTASAQTAVIGGAKIESTGVGILQIDSCDICNYGTDPLPLIRSTYTVMKLHCGFVGTGTGTGCLTDAWIAGGVDAALGTGTPNDAFQGYGSEMTGAGFHQIRRWMVGQQYCNGVVITNNLCDTSCGSNLPDGAPVEIYGSSGNDVTSNFVHDNTIETTNYTIGAVKASYAEQNTLGPNGCFDPASTTQAMYYLDANTAENRIVDGSRPGSVPLVIDLSGNNDYLSASYGSEVRAQAVYFTAGAYAETGGTGFASVSPNGDVASLQSEPSSWPDSQVNIVGRSASQYTDGVTNGTTTFTSASAAFTGADIGSYIYSAGNVPAGTRIIQVVNATTVVLSQPASTSASALTFYMQRAGGNGTSWTFATFDRNHYVSTGGTPTASAEAGSGGGSATVAGTDMAGTVTLTTGAAPAAGFLVALGVTHNFSTQPRVVWQAANAAAASVANEIYDQSTPANLELYTTAALAASTEYIWNYLVLQ